MPSAHTQSGCTRRRCLSTEAPTPPSCRLWPRRSVSRCASSTSSKLTCRSSRTSSASTKPTASPPPQSPRRRSWRKCSLKLWSVRPFEPRRSTLAFPSARASPRRCCRLMTSASHTQDARRTICTTSSTWASTATRAWLWWAPMAAASPPFSSSCPASSPPPRVPSRSTSTACSVCTTSTQPTCFSPTCRPSASCARSSRRHSHARRRRAGVPFWPTLASPQHK
mmetsp:Transcript_23433/g.75758  ORF Transcript_23433/g.75758 Transcript_23433/m.75758 type:complete len:224 (-) Transcript_23433:108-779(-)